MTIGDICSGSRVATSVPALNSVLSAAPFNFDVSGVAGCSLESEPAIGAAASGSGCFSRVGADTVSGAGLFAFYVEESVAIGDARRIEKEMEGLTGCSVGFGTDAGSDLAGATSAEGSGMKLVHAHTKLCDMLEAAECLQLVASAQSTSLILYTINDFIMRLEDLPGSALSALVAGFSVEGSTRCSSTSDAGSGSGFSCIV